MDPQTLAAYILGCGLGILGTVTVIVARASYRRDRTLPPKPSLEEEES